MGASCKGTEKVEEMETQSKEGRILLLFRSKVALFWPKILRGYAEILCVYSLLVFPAIRQKNVLPGPWHPTTTQLVGTWLAMGFPRSAPDSCKCSGWMGFDFKRFCLYILQNHPCSTHQCQSALSAGRCEIPLSLWSGIKCIIYWMDTAISNICAWTRMNFSPSTTRSLAVAFIPFFPA